MDFYCYWINRISPSTCFVPYFGRIGKSIAMFTRKRNSWTTCAFLYESCPQIDHHLKLLSWNQTLRGWFEQPYHRRVSASPKHVEVVQNLLIFLDRLRSTIYQKSFDAVQDIIRLKLYKSSTSTEREICWMSLSSNCWGNWMRLRAIW